MENECESCCQHRDVKNTFIHFDIPESPCQNQEWRHPRRRSHSVPPRKPQLWLVDEQDEAEAPLESPDFCGGWRETFAWNHGFSQSCERCDSVASTASFPFHEV